MQRKPRQYKTKPVPRFLWRHETNRGESVEERWPTYWSESRGGCWEGDGRRNFGRGGRRRARTSWRVRRRPLRLQNGLHNDDRKDSSHQQQDDDADEDLLVWRQTLAEGL